MTISFGDKVRALIVAALIFNGVLHVAYFAADAHAAPAAPVELASSATSLR